jgi:hypothetical protein
LVIKASEYAEASARYVLNPFSVTSSHGTLAYRTPQQCTVRNLCEISRGLANHDALRVISDCCQSTSLADVPVAGFGATKTM